MLDLSYLFDTDLGFRLRLGRRIISGNSDYLDIRVFQVCYLSAWFTLSTRYIFAFTVQSLRQVHRQCHFPRVGRADKHISMGNGSRLQTSLKQRYSPILTYYLPHSIIP